MNITIEEMRSLRHRASAMAERTLESRDLAASIVTEFYNQCGDVDHDDELLAECELLARKADTLGYLARDLGVLMDSLDAAVKRLETLSYLVAAKEPA